MQRVCHVAGGIKSYLEEPNCLVCDQTRECPFCADAHRLELHGWYERWALFPDPQQPVRLPIRRLYCPAAGQTVSLLPDFCLPRRQHGPAILGGFLKAVLDGADLLKALRHVRAETAWHSVAQSLRDGFLRRQVKIRAYAARLHRRVVELPEQVPRSQRTLAELFFGLVEGFKSPATAFVFHTPHFHERFADGLA